MKMPVVIAAVASVTGISGTGVFGGDAPAGSAKRLFEKRCGACKGIALLKQDESLHIAYGIYLLSRLVAEHPDLWDELQTQMNSLLPYAIGVIGDAFGAYEVIPFGLVEDDFINYAMDQFTKRSEQFL